MHIIATRHMEALHNVKRDDKPETFAGNRVDTPLTERGKQDHKVVAEKMRELGGCDIIYASPMLRTQETAKLISQSLAEAEGRVIPIETLPGLTEVDAGDSTGLTREEAAKNHPELLHIFVNNVIGQGDVRQLNFPNGESYETVVQRLQPIIESLKQQVKNGKRIAIVSHANTLKILLEALKDDTAAKVETHTIDMKTVNPEDSRSDGIDNYKVNVIRWQEGQ